MALKVTSQKSAIIGALVLGLVSLLCGVGRSHRLIGLTAAQVLSQAAAGELRLSEASDQIISFVPLVQKLKPQVVQISSTQIDESSPFGGDDPESEFWKRFFENPSSPFSQQSLGSGLIIGSDGFILTNHHVVEDAKRVIVKLPSDETEYPAKVIGTDPLLDIALVKIDAKQLPAASLGDSDQLQIGEWVIAIGNPFGLDSTVTAGIVSAKERRIGESPYESFIQTDAKINPGNSGGPLINMRGEVIGINSTIFSETGESMGIGFAIPINMIKEILPELKAKGKVTRGWIGVFLQRVTQDLAETMGLDQSRGALVTEVAKDGPAARAGIKVGDVIIEFNGKQIKGAEELPILIARATPGEEVRVRLFRDKKELTVSVQIEQLNDGEAVPAQESESPGFNRSEMIPKIAQGSKPGKVFHDVLSTMILNQAFVTTKATSLL